MAGAGPGSSARSRPNAGVCADPRRRLLRTSTGCAGPTSSDACSATAKQASAYRRQRLLEASAAGGAGAGGDARSIKGAVARRPGPRSGHRSDSSEGAASGRSNRCAKRAPLLRSRSLTLRACSSSNSAVGVSCSGGSTFQSRPCSSLGKARVSSRRSSSAVVARPGQASQVPDGRRSLIASPRRPRPGPRVAQSAAFPQLGTFADASRTAVPRGRTARGGYGVTSANSGPARVEVSE